jgi:hypothetical protein
MLERHASTLDKWPLLIPALLCSALLWISCTIPCTTAFASLDDGKVSSIQLLYHYHAHNVKPMLFGNCQYSI